MKDLGLLYEYNHWEQPKKGLFNVIKQPLEDTPEGLAQVQVEKLIIGENEQGFVYQLIKSGYNYWEGDEVIEVCYTLPIWIHKSRLVKWIDTQLELFR